MKKIFLIILLVITTKVFSQWMPSSLTYQINGLAKTSTTVFAGTSSYGLFSTTDIGSSWQPCYGLSNAAIFTVATNSTTVYVKNSDGIWRSTNQGANFTTFNGGVIPANRTIYSLAANSSWVYAGTDSGVAQTTGGNWSYKRPNNSITRLLTFIGTRLFASTALGLFSTTNSGTNWISSNNGLPISGSTYRVEYMTSAGSKLYATSYGRIFKSTDNGLNWDSIPLPGPTYRGHMSSLIVMNNDNLFAGTNNSWSYFKTTNDGLNWSVFTGLPDIYGVKTVISSGIHLVGATNSGIYTALLQTIITKVESETNVTGYSLSQNYPNPSNPSTKISFSVPKSELVTLKVYDVLGRLVETLVSETKTAGTYSIDWNASNYTSGIYFYRLQTNNFNETKRMTLIK